MKEEIDSEKYFSSQILPMARLVGGKGLSEEAVALWIYSDNPLPSEESK